MLSYFLESRTLMMTKKIRLKELREDCFWTQEQVAQKLKIARRTYVEYELQNRMIPINLLCDLAILYQVSVQYICGLTDYRMPLAKYQEFDTDRFLSNLKSLRRKYNLTQKELGEKIACSTENICHYETGERNIPIDVLVSLSKLYNLSLDSILGIIKMD